MGSENQTRSADESETDHLHHRLAAQAQELAELAARCETAERAAEEYHALFQLAGVGISVADPTGRIVRANPRFCELLGYSADELTCMSFADITHPDDRDTSWEQLQALYEGRIPEMQAEKRYLRRDGTAICAALNATLVRDSDGEPRYSIAVIRDITDRVAYEQALRAEEEKLRAVTENISDVFWMSTPGVGRMVYVSRAYERIWGRSRESLYREPRSFIDAIHPDDRPQVVAGLKKHAEGWWNFEYRIIRDDGSIRWIRDRGFPIRGEQGELRFLTGVATDCTAQKTAELRAEEATRALERHAAALERTNRELDQFTAAVSHDLKAPLRAIATLADIVSEELDGNVPESVQEQLALLRGRSQRAGRLVNDLLAYARADRAMGAMERVSTTVLVAEVIEQLGIPPGFHVHVDPCLPEVEGDSAALAQVFGNLINNAIIHHPGTRGDVWVEAHEDGDVFRFSVADNGAGVPPAERERIFEVFYSGASRRAPDSTGIGLALVKKRVEAAGGKVAVEDRPGGGALFTFTWPKRIPGD